MPKLLQVSRGTLLPAPGEHSGQIHVLRCGEHRGRERFLYHVNEEYLGVVRSGDERTYRQDALRSVRPIERNEDALYSRRRRGGR
jgi:hypothetical protein